MNDFEEYGSFTEGERAQTNPMGEKDCVCTNLLCAFVLLMFFRMFHRYEASG